MILCIYYLQQYRAKVADLALQILAISATCLAVFNLFLALSARPMTTRVGSVAVFRNISGLTSLDEKVRPGEEVFVYPYCPMYYFLSATNNPTRYGMLMYNYDTPSHFEEVVRVLEQRRVRYVLWDTHFQAKEVPALFPASLRIRPDEDVHPGGELAFQLFKAPEVAQGERREHKPCLLKIRNWPVC